MNKKMLLLCSLLLVIPVVSAKNKKKLFKKTEVDLRCCGPQSSCFDPVAPICNKRGKRGERGDRGPRGRDVCGLNEIFLNALMTSSFTEQQFFAPFSVASSFAVEDMLPSFSDPDDIVPIGMNFDIPIDLDRTKPVTVVVHMFVDASVDTTGDQAKVQVSIDYKGNNQVLGSVPPATGFADIEVSDDFTVIPADPLSSGNLRMIQVPVALNPALINGDWAFMTIERIAPASDEYDNLLYFATVSVQYSRVCS